MENLNQQQEGRRPECFRLYLYFQSVKPLPGNNGVRDKFRYLLWLLFVIFSLLLFAIFSLLLCLCIVALLLLILPIMPTTYFECKLNSFSITSSSSASTNYDIVFSVTSKYCDYIGLNPAKVSIFYEKQIVCEKLIDPIDLHYSIEEKVHLNFSTPPLPDWVASDFGIEKARNGTLSFEFHLEAIGYVYEKNSLFEISCGYLKTGFSSDSYVVQLINPKKCMVELDGREE